MQTKTVTQIDKLNTNVKVQFVVLDLNMDGKKQYLFPLLGLNICDWVKNALGTLNYTEVIYVPQENVLEFAKQHIDSTFDYTIFLSSNMPLLTPKNIENLMLYVVTKQINSCKFTGGFAFKNEYIKCAKEIFYDSIYTFDLDNFYIVHSKAELKHVTQVLKERIIDYHISQGVLILDSTGVVIEPNVEIEREVEIFTHNVIKGNSYISSETILKENCVIENSIIGKSCCLSSCNVVNSKIDSNTYISPYVSINNSVVGKNVTILSNVDISNDTILDNSKVVPKEKK